MKDYISREAAIKAAMQDTGFNRSHEFNAGCARAANNLKAIPAADVAPVVHGRWIKKDILHCSECDMPTIRPWPYCQNCGAKMQEAKQMRLIDSDALASDLTRFYENEVTAKKLIDEQPTIDAVPVVRCRDCKKGWPAGEYVYCMKPYAGHWPTHKWDWYCADAERKEDVDERTR